MKIHKKMIVRFLAIFILWAGGMSVLACTYTGNSTDCSGTGFECFDITDNGSGNPQSIAPNGLCLSDNAGGTAYCVNPSMGIIYTGVSIGGCTGTDMAVWFASALPLSDASFLLILLLGAYGFFIYRKKKYQTA